jgi:hypothetical protein
MQRFSDILKKSKTETIVEICIHKMTGNIDDDIEQFLFLYKLHEGEQTVTRNGKTFNRNIASVIQEIQSIPLLLE